MGNIGITFSSDEPFFGELPWISDDDLHLADEEDNRVALSAFYEKRRREIGGLVAVLLGRRVGLEDVIAHTFLRAFRSIKRLRSSQSLDIWLKGYAVAAFVRYSLTRRPRRAPDSRRRRPRAVLHDFRVCPETLHHHLDELPLLRRTVFVMSEMQGLDVRTIAQILGAPLFATKLILYYARRKFYRGLFRTTTL